MQNKTYIIFIYIFTAMISLFIIGSVIAMRKHKSRSVNLAALIDDLTTIDFEGLNKYMPSDTLAFKSHILEEIMKIDQDSVYTHYFFNDNTVSSNQIKHILFFVFKSMPFYCIKNDIDFKNDNFLFLKVIFIHRENFEMVIKFKKEKEQYKLFEIENMHTLLYFLKPVIEYNKIETAK